MVTTTIMTVTQPKTMGREWETRDPFLAQLGRSSMFSHRCSTPTSHCFKAQLMHNSLEESSRR